MTTPRQVLDAAVSEQDWQKWVIDYAHLKAWTAVHHRPARIGRTYINKKGEVKESWQTHYQGDGKGEWDLHLYRERVVVIECKTEKGTLSPEQEHWGYVYEGAGQEHYCLRPSDFERVMKVLE